MSSLFLQVTKACPSDKDARVKFEECNKICKRLAFEKAIASDDGKCVADTIDITSLGLCHFHFSSFCIVKLSL